MANNRREIVLVDTNVLFSQDKREIVNSTFKEFFDAYANQFNLKLMIPEVVKGELKYQITHHLSSQLSKVNEAVRVLSSATGKKYTHRISEERIKKVIHEHLGVDEHKIISTANIYDDFRADSLDCIELIMAIEEEFYIEIPDDDAEDKVTVGAIIKYVETRVT